LQAGRLHHKASGTIVVHPLQAGRLHHKASETIVVHASRVHGGGGIPNS
jgi:hypothetical protein